MTLLGLICRNGRSHVPTSCACGDRTFRLNAKLLIVLIFDNGLKFLHLMALPNPDRPHSFLISNIKFSSNRARRFRYS
ncbi:MAG: hypothetical protein JGK32_12405 [Microcoleus sp. PH2017_31_RDM_U_A]|uniref:hypothetical protein n=1 Tax=Microcoleus sp. PH2017_32_RDM_D_A TaxID=2798842 RepID=UPI001D39FDCB|nr:hypothetical protein [Microcoleus sp. PH2017_32_RDM_D_A]MCC3465935.1 hypothetical protein [Microcoleus sp. PH2017_06_SFM_O_A]MCC3566127.1 hypothetical protein [Microcoleus sp. PH2017_31_RDM_U_A]